MSWKQVDERLEQVKHIMTPSEQKLYEHFYLHLKEEQDYAVKLYYLTRCRDVLDIAKERIKREKSK